MKSQTKVLQKLKLIYRRVLRERPKFFKENLPIILAGALTMVLAQIALVATPVAMGNLFDSLSKNLTLNWANTMQVLLYGVLLWLSKSGAEPKRLALVYKQTNAALPAHTDEHSFLGAALVAVSDDGKTLEGNYWTNRSWDKGLNAAGRITFTKIE